MYEACTPLFLQWAAAKTTSPQVQQFDTGGPLEPVKTNPGVLLVVVNFEEQEPAAVPNGADGAGFCPLRADQVPLVPESTRRWPPLSRTARPLDKVKVP